MGGIGAVAEPVLEGAVFGLAGRLQDGAVHIEQPAVVAAPDAPFGHQAKLQGRATVGTMGLNQTYPAAEVAERDQLLAEDLHGHRQVFEIVGEGHRLPKSA